MTNGRKKLYQWPVYRNSSTFFHKYSDQNLQVFPILPTHILYIFNKYGVQQIYFTFSTNIFNNGCLVWQTQAGIKYTSGLLMQQFYLSQQTFRLLVFKRSGYWFKTWKRISYIYSRNISYILDKYFQQLFGWCDKWQRGWNIPGDYSGYRENAFAV